ncbi:MAG: hypothetical protein ACREL7_09690 [Longimicrobiales bacterium]
MEAIADRIRRYNSDISPSSDTFRAACLLLSALEFGQNIDVLSRRTGLDRGFVARCARRLIDNGVWKGGETAAEWSSADEASGTFWNDVAVAEGKMCRRVVAGGKVEWAPAGYWNKSFHFTDPEADTRLVNKYLDPDASVPETSPDPDQKLSDDSTGAGTGSRDHDQQDEAAHPDADSPDGDEGQPPVPPLDRLFRDVTWIG